jgi:hypothetical protein
MPPTVIQCDLQGAASLVPSYYVKGNIDVYMYVCIHIYVMYSSSLHTSMKTTGPCQTETDRYERYGTACGKRS